MQDVYCEFDFPRSRESDANVEFEVFEMIPRLAKFQWRPGKFLDDPASSLRSNSSRAALAQCLQ